MAPMPAKPRKAPTKGLQVFKTFCQNSTFHRICIQVLLKWQLHAIQKVIDYTMLKTVFFKKFDWLLGLKSV